MEYKRGCCNRGAEQKGCNSKDNVLRISFSPQSGKTGGSTGLTFQVRLFEAMRVHGYTTMTTRFN